MTLPVLVTEALAASIDDAIKIADYLFAFNRQELSDEYQAHVQVGLEKLRQMMAELEQLQMEDVRLREAEQARIEEAEADQGKPWTQPNTPLFISAHKPHKPAAAEAREKTAQKAEDARRKSPWIKY